MCLPRQGASQRHRDVHDGCSQLGGACNRAGRCHSADERCTAGPLYVCTVEQQEYSGSLGEPPRRTWVHQRYFSKHCIKKLHFTVRFANLNGFANAVVYGLNDGMKDTLRECCSGSTLFDQDSLQETGSTDSQPNMVSNTALQTEAKDDKQQEKAKNEGTEHNKQDVVTCQISMGDKVGQPV